ncbi:MAG: citrate synthase/methylcitrate synthase [Nannocystaceae bacterium]|nr:citrate synthase/methylcitrate synthase [Nannocystaceae bacterium]
MKPQMAPPGLEGVVVGESRLSRVDGLAGTLTLAGYAVEDLAPQSTFEEVIHLLLHDALPPDEQWARRLASHRVLPAGILDVLRTAADRDATPMTALRLGIAALGLHNPSDLQLVGSTPTIVAAYDRLRRGFVPIAPNLELGFAADALRMRTGVAAEAPQIRALNTYLCTVVDHGLNASAFAARVVASTGAAMSSCVEAGVCALEGPLHGGAPGPALRALLELREAGGDLHDATAAWVREQLATGQRIMGFGHRVYRVRDPRSVVLRNAANTLLGDAALLRDAQVHERAVLETLAELKPGRSIATNVEFATALLLNALDFPEDVFTAVFAMARTAGWVAHAREQRADGRLIRPRLAYAGAQGRRLPA